MGVGRKASGWYTIRKVTSYKPLVRKKEEGDLRKISGWKKGGRRPRIMGGRKLC